MKIKDLGISIDFFHTHTHTYTHKQGGLQLASAFTRLRMKVQSIISIRHQSLAMVGSYRVCRVHGVAAAAVAAAAAAESPCLHPASYLSVQRLLVAALAFLQGTHL